MGQGYLSKKKKRWDKAKKKMKNYKCVLKTNTKKEREFKITAKHLLELQKTMCYWVPTWECVNYPYDGCKNIICLIKNRCKT